MGPLDHNNYEQSFRRFFLFSFAFCKKKQHHQSRNASIYKTKKEIGFVLSSNLELYFGSGLNIFFMFPQTWN